MKKIMVGRIIQDGNYKGTGFLVAPDLVMTAKHNVIIGDELLEEPYEEKEVVFKIDNEDGVIGTTINLFEAIEKRIDCVLIRLSEVISRDKMFHLVDASNSIIGLECKIVGYPKIRDQFLKLSATIGNFQDEKMIVKIKIGEQLSDYKGMSGSPIIALGNIVVGIVILQEDCESLEALPIGYIHKRLMVDDIVVEKREIPLGISFNMEKISQKVKLVVSMAGPRYNQKLNIKTGTYSNLCFLLGKGELKDRLKDINSKLDACIEKLMSFDSYNQNESNLVLEESRKGITDVVNVLEDQKIYLVSDKYDKDEIKLVPINIKECEQKLFGIFEVEKQRFEEKNGAGTYNNISWRGFMASYMCTFPAHYLDELKSVITALPIIAGLFDDILLINPEKKAILITGQGGIGKTHLLCDIVNNYIERDIPAILLLGDKFNINDTVKDIITNEYCKGDKIENLFGWLNEYGEQNEVYIPICIDAINEVEDNSYWNRNLPILIAQTEIYSNIKVIVSCRSIYLEEYLDESIIDNMVNIPHEGFSEIENEALNEFCEYYDVHISYETMSVPEFMNPLFLKMLCDMASENDDRTVIVDDINSLMEKYFDMKNKIISKSYPETFSIKDKVVQLALDCITEYMINNDQYSISWGELRKIIKEVLEKFGVTGIVSGFIKKLISENILREADGGDKNITFAYQKYFEYIHARKYADEDVNTIINAVEEKNITLGTLEMIQILFFRKTGQELISKVDNSIHGELVETFMSGLYWRKNQDFNENTVSEVDELLSYNDSDARRVITGLISISTKSDCPVNALYIHKKLSSMKACKRDSFMSYFLIKQYNQNRTLSEICERAISLRKKDYSYDNIFLWKLMLCWGTSSNDIKLRDKASKGLVNLFRLYPKDMINILKMFSNIDDDYISERIWQALYSALIFLSDPEYTRPVLNYIKKNIIEPDVWPQNILLRNYLRNIYEFAFANGWITDKEVLLVRPPYKSKKHSANHQFASANQDGYKKLFWNCQDSDFAIYSIPSEVEDYGITKKDVGIMIFEDIIKGGYNNFCKDLDARIDYQYGSLRSRDSEIERIGKKYQRIYLYRELGNIFDNYDYKPRYDWKDNSEELGCGNLFRSIDLTSL